MAWYIYSILGAVCFSGMILSVRKLTNRGFSSKQVLFFLCGFVFLGFLALNIFSPSNLWHSDKLPYFFAIMLAVGIFSSFANWADFEGVKKAPNPGYPVAIRNATILPVVLLSVLFFNSELTLLKFFGVMLIILGIISLVLEKNKISDTTVKSSPWRLFPFIALLGSTIAVLGIKQATLIPFVSSKEVNLFTFLLNFIFFTLVSHKELKNYFSDKNKLKSFLPFVILVAAFSFVGNLLAIKGLSIAPNPGYHEAIKNTHMLFTTLLSIKLFSLKVNKFKILGVILIIAGIIILIV